MCLTVNDTCSFSVPDEHVPEDGEVTVVAVFNYEEKNPTKLSVRNKYPAQSNISNIMGTFTHQT